MGWKRDDKMRGRFRGVCRWWCCIAVLWCNAGVTVKAKVTKVLVGQPSECTSYVSLTPASSFPAKSEIQCAAYCNLKRAMRYSYGEDTCGLVGIGLNQGEGQSSTFTTPTTTHPLEDIATGKVTHSSPVYKNYPSSLAVDTNDEDTSMYHSTPISSPWWLIDLGKVRTIHEVQIISRRLSSTIRFHHIEVRVGQELTTSGDFSGYTLMSTYLGPYTGDQGRLTCPGPPQGITGRYISIQRPTNHLDALQIVDVNVFVRT